MAYLFDHLSIVETAIRKSPFGFMTDVDGTISKTAPTPNEAKISPVFRDYLSLLTRKYAMVAAISGRSVINMRTMINIDSMVYVGNHGLEKWVGGALKQIKDAHSYVKLITTVQAELSSAINDPFITLENKGITLSIHYRLHPDHSEAKRIISTALQNSRKVNNLRIVPGRRSVSILPLVAANKGTSITELIREYGLYGGLYMGDDVTDIDAFRAIRTASRNSHFKGIAIGIISDEMPDTLESETDLTLNGVDDVERFLKWLLQPSLPSN